MRRSRARPEFRRDEPIRHRQWDPEAKASTEDCKDLPPPSDHRAGRRLRGPALTPAASDAAAGRYSPRSGYVHIEGPQPPAGEQATDVSVRSHVLKLA